MSDLTRHLDRCLTQYRKDLNSALTRFRNEALFGLAADAVTGRDHTDIHRAILDHATAQQPLNEALVAALREQLIQVYEEPTLDVCERLFDEAEVPDEPHLSDWQTGTHIDTLPLQVNPPTPRYVLAVIKPRTRVTGQPVCDPRSTTTLSSS